MVNVRQFRFETSIVTLHNPHLIEVDPIQLRKRGIEEYSVDMMLNDTEAKKLWAKIEIVRENCLPHLPTQSKLKIPGQLDDKTGLIRFTARAYAKYGQPEVIYSAGLNPPAGSAVNDMIEVKEEVPNGARGRCFGSIHPFQDYGGGIRLVIKKVVILRQIEPRYQEPKLHSPQSVSR